MGWSSLDFMGAVGKLSRKALHPAASLFPGSLLAEDTLSQRVRGEQGAALPLGRDAVARSQGVLPRALGAMS